MNLLNWPDWEVGEVQESAHDYRVKALYLHFPTACVHCGGRRLHRFGAKWREAADRPHEGKPVRLSFRLSRGRCKDCRRTTLAAPPQIHDRLRMTRRLVAWLRRRLPKSGASELGRAAGLTEGTVRRLLSRLDEARVLEDRQRHRAKPTRSAPRQSEEE